VPSPPAALSFGEAWAELTSFRVVCSAVRVILLRDLFLQIYCICATMESRFHFPPEM